MARPTSSKKEHKGVQFVIDCVIPVGVRIDDLVAKKNWHWQIDTRSIDFVMPIIKSIKARYTGRVIVLDKWKS